MKRLIHGYIARGVEHTKPRRGPVNMQMYELDLREVGLMTPKVIGAPMQIEHPDFGAVRVGTVVSCSLTPQNDWLIGAEIDTTPGSPGEWAAAIMDCGYARKLSLTHLLPTYDVVEVSIVQVPARAGSDIIDGFIPIEDELKRAFYKTDYGRIAASLIIRASASSVVDGPNVIRAALPPTLFASAQEAVAPTPPVVVVVVSANMSDQQQQEIFVPGLGSATSNLPVHEQRRQQMAARGMKTDWGSASPFAPPPSSQQQQQQSTLPTLVTPSQQQGEADRPGMGLGGGSGGGGGEREQPPSTTSSPPPSSSPPPPPLHGKSSSRDQHGRFLGQKKALPPALPSSSTSMAMEENPDEGIGSEANDDDYDLKGEDPDKAFEGVLANKEVSTKAKKRLVGIKTAEQKKARELEAKLAAAEASNRELEEKLKAHSQKEQQQQMSAHALSTWDRNAAHGLTHPGRGQQIRDEIEKGSIDLAKKIASDRLSASVSTESPPAPTPPPSSPSPSYLRRQQEDEEIIRRHRTLMDMRARDTGRSTVPASYPSSLYPLASPPPPPPPQGATHAEMRDYYADLARGVSASQPPPPPRAPPAPEFDPDDKPARSAFGHIIGQTHRWKDRTSMGMDGVVRASHPGFEVKARENPHGYGGNTRMLKSFASKYIPGGEPMQSDWRPGKTDPRDIATTIRAAHPMTSKWHRSFGSDGKGQGESKANGISGLTGSIGGRSPACRVVNLRVPPLHVFPEFIMPQTHEILEGDGTDVGDDVILSEEMLQRGAKRSARPY